MHILFKIVLFIHIISGCLSLITGTINIIRKKGDETHKRAGRLFTYSMVSSAGAALLLSILHPNPFLFIVGIFTLYLVGTGTRYLCIKATTTGLKPYLIDWILSVGMLLAGIIFVMLGITHLISGTYFGIVYFVFGLLGLAFVKTDYSNYKGAYKKGNFRLTAHIQRITGGYIAATTAFLVVNAHYLPPKLPSVLIWLLPTLIITPFIIKWSKKYQTK